MQADQIVFVVECCQNAKEHAWNTRLDEAKYIEFFKKQAAAIIERIPNAIIMKNQIPKNYLHFDLYNNLIQNEDETCPYYQQVPRIWAFEVSYKGMLIFSKLKGGYWPNTELVADKCAAVVQEEAQGRDCTMYLAGNTPIKGGGYVQSQAKPREKKGASPGRKSGMHGPPQGGAQAQHQAPQPTAFNEIPEQSLRGNESGPPLQTKFTITQGTAQSPSEDVMVGSHLNDPGDLTGFPIFPSGTKSLLSKLMSRDIWDKYKYQKDKCNFTFKEAIFSGCKNTDSGIGVYAGCHQSYTEFSDLFDRIIETYHGHKKTDKHIAENPNVGLNAPDFPPEEAAMIMSTRIRVGRNLAGYPLAPGIYDTQQRAEVEGYVLEALKTFDGELKGKYYGLGSMTQAEQTQLIADHFLFKEGDRFLEACGVNRDWPNNRGIFHNDAKTFLVWVNEEDQLRVISMQKGANIRQVFERLMLALAKFENVAKFAYDDHLGYITSCPTNLGTAMRASVHIKLPLLSKHKDEFQAIADKYHVQIRGAHGEHTETDDGIFDISNKRRLGMSMTMLVQDMYDGVKAMIKRELELMGPSMAPQQAAPPKEAAPAQAAAPAKAAPIKAGPHLKNPEDITGFPEFPAGTKSLLCKYLTPQTYEMYKGKKDACGVSFERMILSGTQNTDSGIGIYAGCHESYYEFGPALFDEIIMDYHKHGLKDKHVSNMNYQELNCPPFTEDEASRILSTRIRVGRNLANFPLGPGITKDQRNQVEATVSGVLSKFTGELGGKYYALKTMTKEDQQQLIDDHFLFKEGDRFLDACGLNRDWPEGRGIFHNDAKTFLVWINEEDQLRIISMQKGADILSVFTRLSIAAGEIEKVAQFAHDEHLGYITSCPTNLGTALRASVHIKLPLLGKDKAAFNAIADKYYVQIRGIHGEHTETDDGIFDISNKRRLGRSEKDLVQDMYDGVKAMISAEKELEAKAGIKPAAAAAPASAEPTAQTAPAASGAKVQAGPHLQSIADVTGMVEFPAGTKSSVARFMTEEVYNEYKGKCDKAGVPFELMVLSGCQNIDSGIGVYAGSHDSYYTFPKLFDAVIEDYHKHGKEDKHVSNMNYQELNCPPFSPIEAGMILSTRIRVGRNLAEYPLGPGISKEQRNEVEAKVSGVLSKFTGELGGKYYSLKSMTKEEQQQLIDDHFLFKEGDRFLAACGLNRDWPEGRGIFHNDAKTFLVWINEEDQLRIISMQKGADILAVFTRLSIAAGEIEKVAKFAHDEHLGYITSCPTNLGTALRASVHIKLPFLAKDKPTLQAIADKYYVQIRGIHGEHTETDDGIFDISNKRRLGRSEKDLVQDMYSGVKEMMKVEMEMAEKAGFVLAGPHLKSVDQLTGPILFPASCRSLLCQYLTPEIFNKYKDAKDAAGVPFKLMVMSGAQNIDSGIGLYAGSHDSYTTFAELFDPVIEHYHKHGKQDKHISDMDFTKLNCPPFSAEEAAMIISTRIRVGRNLADYPLGPGVSKAQREEIMAKVVEACGKFEGELQGKFYPLEGMKPEDQQQLIDDHFLFKEGDRFLDACGLNRDWPSGRGIFHNDAKTFLVWVNEEDQLRIISMQPGADILAVFTRLSTAAGIIEQVAKFAHDDHLGYITSCPTNLGTALRASVHIKLPLLGKQKDKFNAIADKYYVQIRGIHGEHTETDDGIFDISNKRRLGRSERDLVQDMYDGVKAMIAAENELASKK